MIKNIFWRLKLFFKEYIQNLTKIQLFQVYSLLAICIIYPYIKLLEIKDNSSFSNENISMLNKNIKQIDKKLQIPNFIEVLKDFESEAKKHKTLKIKSFDFDKKSITINGISNEKDLLKYLLYCENYTYSSILNSLSFKHIPNSKKISFSFNITFKKSYSKKLSDDILEKYNTLTSNSNIVHKQSEFKLQGILNDFVIIDNTLLSKGDTYKNYKLEKINNDNVVLSKKMTTKTLFLKSIENEKYSK